MPDRLVECVPNFSEGRDETIINAIREAIAAVPGVKVLDVDPGADFNRTVYTFVGAPEAVVEGALAGAREGLKLIDMTRHNGEHPRMGALDICPFIPISGVTMEDCVKLSELFGQRFASELGVPVYLYAEASRVPERYRLPDIRKGEYEALKDKLTKPEWAPEFGEPVFVPRSGATVTGARQFLIAYNVNLATDDKKAANTIAGKLRTSGVPQRDDEGEIIRDDDGKALRFPGRLQALQGGGMMYSADIAQVSMNLMDYTVTGMETAYEEVKKEAQTLGITVSGSELVGLAPKEAFLQAGRSYLPDGTGEQNLVATAVERLGLTDLGPFDAREKIIEYLIQED